MAVGQPQHLRQHRAHRAGVGDDERGGAGGVAEPGQRRSHPRIQRVQRFATGRRMAARIPHKRRMRVSIAQRGFIWLQVFPGAKIELVPIGIDCAIDAPVSGD